MMLGVDARKLCCKPVACRRMLSEAAYTVAVLPWVLEYGANTANLQRRERGVAQTAAYMDPERLVSWDQETRRLRRRILEACRRADLGWPKQSQCVEQLWRSSGGDLRITGVEIPETFVP